MKGIMTMTKYEFTMQIRRPALWIATLIVLSICIWDSFPNPQNLHRLNNLTNHYYAAMRVADLYVEMLILIAVFLVGDRILRDKKLRTFEIIMSTPVSQGAYVFGKYLGNFGAVLLMPFILIFVSAIVQGIYNPSPFLLKPYLMAFFLIGIPSMSYVTGLSISFPSMLGGVKLFYASFLAYYMYSVTVFRNTFEIPFYELIADASKLVFYSGQAEFMPYTSAYLNVLFLAITGNLAVFLYYIYGYKRGRAV